MRDTKSWCVLVALTLGGLSGLPLGWWLGFQSDCTPIVRANGNTPGGSVYITAAQWSNSPQGWFIEAYGVYQITQPGLKFEDLRLYYMPVAGGDPKWNVAREDQWFQWTCNTVVLDNTVAYKLQAKLYAWDAAGNETVWYSNVVQIDP